jgi:hypothetical protein
MLARWSPAERRAWRPQRSQLPTGVGSSCIPPRDDGAHIDADGDGFTLAQTRRFDGGRLGV